MNRKKSTIFCGRQAKLRFAQNLPILSEFPSGNSLSPTPTTSFSYINFILYISQGLYPKSFSFLYKILLIFTVVYLFLFCQHFLFDSICFLIVFPFLVFGFVMVSSSFLSQEFCLLVEKSTAQHLVC